MKSLGALIAVLFFGFSFQPQGHAVQRPRILGIDHVSFYTTQPEGVKALYSGTLGLSAATPVESGELARYMVGQQWVGFRSLKNSDATDRLDHIAFATDNIAGLGEFLKANGVKVAGMESRADHSLSLSVVDPEGNRVEFIQRDKAAPAVTAPDSAVSHHMIHTGFLVHNREVEDRFYRDLLGFRLYWHGGMQSGKTDWVAMQVPDGTDWLEYMLNQAEHPDLRTMGVLDHISLGVADMRKAQAVLESHGWKPHGDEKSQMGKDGKWQLNVFDPDLSRIELMEFKPVEKPCCADFTGPHPAE